MKKNLFPVLGIAAILAGCQVVELSQPVEGEAFRIEAKIEGTKTTFTPPYAVIWDSDDAISVIVNDNSAYKGYEFTRSASGDNVFECTTYTPTGTETDYSLFYPYNSKNTSIGSDGYCLGYFTIGSSAIGVQTQAGVNDGSHIDAPLCGYATAADLANGVKMKHVSALLKVSVINSTDVALDVAKVVITTSESKDLVGTFYINPQTGAIKGRGTNFVSSTATLNVTNGSVASATTGNFYLTTAPFTLAANSTLTVTVTTSDGAKYEQVITMTAETAFAAGEIGTILFTIDTVQQLGPGKDLPFEDDFAEASAGSISNQSSPWSTAVSTNFEVSSSAVYQAGGAVKLGTASDVGTITTKEFFNLSDAFTVILYGTGWAGEERTLTVTVGTQSKDVTFTTDKSAGTYECQYVYFSGESERARISVSNVAKQRVFIDNIEVVTGQWTPAPVLNSVTTEEPKFDATSAVLNGCYDAEFLGASDVLIYGFEWGTSSASLTTVTATNASAGVYSYDLTGLTTGTTYIVKAWAQLNSGDKVYGAEKTFTTAEPVGIDPNFSITTYNAVPDGWDGEVTTGSYFRFNSTSSLTSPLLDMSKCTAAAVSIDLATYNGSSSQSLILNVSYDGGATFTESIEFEAPTSATTYVTRTYNLAGPFTNKVILKLTPNANCTGGKGVRVKNYTLTPTMTE